MCILETPVTESLEPAAGSSSVRYRALVDREESLELATATWMSQREDE
jgi:hypothetical protein